MSKVSTERCIDTSQNKRDTDKGGLFVVLGRLMIHGELRGLAWYAEAYGCGGNGESAHGTCAPLLCFSHSARG